MHWGACVRHMEKHMFPHPLSWWSCESEISLTKNDRKGNFIHIYIFYIYVSNMYMLNSTIIQKREQKFISPLELIRETEWIYGWVLLGLYSNKCYISGAWISLKNFSSAGNKEWYNNRVQSLLVMKLTNYFYRISMQNLSCIWVCLLYGNLSGSSCVITAIF